MANFFWFVDFALVVFSIVAALYGLSRGVYYLAKLMMEEYEHNAVFGLYYRTPVWWIVSTQFIFPVIVAYRTYIVEFSSWIAVVGVGLVGFVGVLLLMFSKMTSRVTLVHRGFWITVILGGVANFVGMFVMSLYLFK